MLLVFEGKSPPGQFQAYNTYTLDFPRHPTMVTAQKKVKEGLRLLDECWPVPSSPQPLRNTTASGTQ